MNSNSIPFILGVIFIAIRVVFFEEILISAIGIGFWLAISIRFIYLLGKEFPIKEFIILLASFQWIVGAKLSYLQGKVHYKYYMYVDESTYMNYVVVGTILFSIGLAFIKLPPVFEKLQLIGENNTRQINAKAITIISYGLVSILISTTFSSLGLDFILYLINLFIFIGAAYLMISMPKNRWLVFGITIIVVFIRALIIGLFHDVFLVGGLLIFFLFRPNSTFISKISLIIVGAFTVYATQIIKKDYRQFAWGGNNKLDSFEVFSNLLLQEFSNQNIGYEINTIRSANIEEQESAEVTARLNQGWIISKIMDYIPRQRSYLGGETIRKSIEASVLPRFLAPDKAGGGYAKIVFQDATGLELYGSTSMGLSVIGEVYANYGVEGGWFAIFIYGFVLAFFMNFIIKRLGEGAPLILCWFIFFFFQTVKAESNFITVFNHLTKAIILFWILKLILIQFNVDVLSIIKPKKKMIE